MLIILLINIIILYLYKKKKYRSKEVIIEYVITFGSLIILSFIIYTSVLDSDKMYILYISIIII